MKVADLFCGMGGFSEGFKKAGYQIVYALDNDEDCVKTYEKNNPDTEVVLSDIEKIHEIPKVDIIIGSPPCQVFSIATRSHARTYDTSLIKEFFRIFKLSGARYWIMENVINIRKVVNENHLILNAKYFGVPQNRKRFFASNFFIKPKRHDIIKTVKQTFNLPNGSFMLDSRMAHFSKIREIISVNKPSPTLTTKCNGLHIAIPSERSNYVNCAKPLIEFVEKNFRYPVNMHRITVEECLILQGFDTNFKINENNKAYYMIGNSVCPPVAEAIAKSCVLRNLEDLK